MTFPRYITPVILGTATVAIVVQSPVVLAQTKTADQIRTIAQGITVRIDGPGRPGNNGSGIIIERQGNTYTVLTCWHVVDEAGQYTIQTTSDNQRYTVNYSQIQQPDKNIDIAIIKFTSDKTYPVAKQGNSKQLKNGMTLYAAGWYNPGAVVKERIFDVPKGRFVSEVTPNNGYALAYQLDLAQPGMSGGPLLNEQGEVIAVNGLAQVDLRTGTVDLTTGVPIQTIVATRSTIPPTQPTPVDTSPTAEVERLISLGQTKINQKDPQAAVDALTKAINLDPKNAKAYLYRGYTYRNLLKDYQKAILDYTQAIKLDPNLAAAYNNRGFAYYALAYYSRGLAYLNLKDYDRAIADYNQAIKLDPNYADAYNNRGNAYYDLKDYNRAIADYNQAIKLDPNLANAYYSRGFIYNELGNRNQAREDFQQAARLFKEQNNTQWYQNSLDGLRELE